MTLPPSAEPTELWGDRVLRGLKVLVRELRAINAPLRELLNAEPLPHAESVRRFRFEPSAADGFVVQCLVSPQRCQVFLDRWTLDLRDGHDEPDEAAGFVLLSLTAHCRLAVTLAGDKPFRWQPFVRHGGDWDPLPAQGTWWYPWWAPKQTMTRQNGLLVWERYQVARSNDQRE